jgi:hypothetical protein
MPGRTWPILNLSLQKNNQLQDGWINKTEPVRIITGFDFDTLQAVKSLCISVKSEQQSVNRQGFSKINITKLTAYLMEINLFDLKFNATLYYATSKMFVS